MSAEAKLALKKEIQNYNDMKKANNLNQNGAIDQAALLKAREAEIEDLKATLTRSRQDYADLQAKYDELQKKREETPAKIEVIRHVTDELKGVIGNLLSDDMGEEVQVKAVVRYLLPITYTLVGIDGTK